MLLINFNEYFLRQLLKVAFFNFLIYNVVILIYWGIIMKIKENFILRKISGSFVVVPVGDAVVDFSGLINLNETGAFLFERLQQGAEETDLVNALLSEYDVTKECAQNDVKVFVNKLKDAGIVE